MYQLLSGPKRFGELQKLLSPINQHMLILKLRELEQMGVLTRHASGQKSLKGEYRLSQPGQNAEPLLHQIYAWGRWACDQLGLAYDGPVMDERETYARRA
jgi:DNA-binding HxlR family transcriptional regulator